jgi:RNA polymerase sigma-70 factor (ECF subfamily)
MQRLELGEADLDELERLVEEPIAVALLSELPAEQRDAVRGRILLQRSYRQLARETGLPEATLRKRVSRGLATLRLRLRGEADA